MQRKDKIKSRRETSLTAVAFQDHIAREFGLIREIQQGNSQRTQLTLAQKLGLVASPPAPLTDTQWDKAKEASRLRGDSSQPCPICQDVFGLQKQVLLSCTHTFHKSCLAAFERYSGKKCCPLCRTQKYESKLINSGAKYHRETAAIKIQSVWKGYKVRKWFNKYRETHPPSHPLLRAKYYKKKFTSLTSEILESVSSTTEQANNLLISVNADLEESRRTMRSLELQLLDPNWDSVTMKALQYTTTDCVICLAPLSLPRPLTVLSCSHLFHTACISSLESFTSDYTLHSCPICRSPYLSRAYTTSSNDD